MVDLHEQSTLTKTDQILGRLRASKTFMDPFVAKSKRSANRYLDSSSSLNSTGPEWAQGASRDLPIGEVNYLAMNIRQKVAAMSIAAPDFYVTTGEANNAELVRKAIRDEWRKKQWTRLFQRVLTARFVQGMGFVAYLWDRQKGYTLEYVKAEDVYFDPHTTDATWDNPRWGGRTVLLPHDAAYAKYGREKFQQPQHDNSTEQPVTVTDVTEQESQSLKITLYWDDTTEAHFYGSTLLLATKNFYGRVPIRTLQGDVNPHPTDEFPLSDYDTSLGCFEMLRRMQNILNHCAANGGGQLWLNSQYIDEKQRNKVINGTHSGPILVNGVPDGGAVLGYTANQQLNPAVMEAIKMLAGGLDADQGVTEYDRGVIQNNPKFATQAALLQRSAGARGNLSRTQFEQFTESIAKSMVELTVKFGIDPEGGPPTDEAVAAWDAFGDVQDLRVIEESQNFKDPGMVQQQNMQLYELAANSLPLMQQFGVVPNLKTMFDDILRSFDRKNVDEYYIQLPPQVPGPVGPDGQPTGGPPPEQQQGGAPTAQGPAPGQPAQAPQGDEFSQHTMIA